jgi:predicted nuclease of restriction endonuclease-like (RecB) superfamily
MRTKNPRKAKVALVTTMPAVPVEAAFAEVVNLIEQARQRAYQAVNTELVQLYWRIGEYIGRKIESAEWGDGVVDQLAAFLARTQPGLRGFTRRNLFRMRQFHDTYVGDKKVTPLVTQLPWTHHLIIMGQCKRPEEREFYAMNEPPEKEWPKQNGLFKRKPRRKAINSVTR